MILAVDDLSCGYGRHNVIQGVSLSMEEGGIVGIIGPNGSGKTTFIRAVTKVLPPKKRSIFIDGRDLSALHYRDIAKIIAVVSPMEYADLDISVEDFVSLGRIPHRGGFQIAEGKEDREAVRDAMTQTDTLRFSRRLICNMSSGERQLVNVAKALAQDPKLLILDEPTSHLDITHQVRVLDLIKRLNRRNGISVIIVLHDLNLAGQYCDRLILFNNGRVHKEGVPEEVLTYNVIEEVYKTIVVVGTDPVSAKPYVILVSEEYRERIIPSPDGGK